MSEKYIKLAIDRVESILTRMNVEYAPRDGCINLKCPIHGSEDVCSSIIYLRDPFAWICFSHGCSDKYGKSIIGLIKGYLETNNKPSNWQNIIDFIYDGHIINPINVTKKDRLDLFKDEKSMPETIVPSKYFITRGYSPSSLIYYGVGDAVRGVWQNRAIVPVRYVNGEYMGFSARIHWPECKQCNYHHSKYETCLSKSHDFHFMYKKWYHSKGMQKSQTLYGIDKIPKNTKKVAIVEGPGDVWKLSDYGLIVVACMGKDFSKLRLNLLKNLGIEKVLFIADKDDAGEEFRNRFISDYHKDLDIYFPNLTSKDPSEMKDEDIKKHIVEKWEKI